MVILREKLAVCPRFISVDDAQPPDSPDAKGFVSYLYDQLQYEFLSGKPRPKIWRDTRRIGKGDLFDPVIEEALGSSAILLVVQEFKQFLYSGVDGEREGDELFHARKDTSAYIGSAHHHPREAAMQGVGVGRRAVAIIIDMLLRSS